MENWGMEKSDHITWKLYKLYINFQFIYQFIYHNHPEVAEIVDNEVMHPKNKNLLTRLI